MSTIKEVAKRAGVSTSTVSRTLSGNIPVNEITKEKVLLAVKELNYNPNTLAKGLKQGKTRWNKQRQREKPAKQWENQGMTKKWTMKKKNQQV